ncbi:MAG TPA: BON domain-containing protein [Pseudobdellovibrionaceae bacterium]|mgnify:CR=1 FL=1|nr:BON domain-containing protein [Pseudobdellovibrionaceae bacterium]
MNSSKRPLLTIAAVLFSAGFAFAEGTPVQQDNPSRNRQDGSVVTPTADQQGNSKNDLEITRRIRADLVANKGLSTYAQNIKVITQNGKVTLRGPVRSAAEKSEAERIARAVAGATSVTNDLSIAK